MSRFGDPYAPSERALPMSLGRFQFLRPIATGSTSDVIVARETGPFGFDRTVALKVLLPALRDDERHKQAFAIEATACARLTHPAVAQIHGVLDAPGELALILEHVEGMALNQLRAELHRRGEVIGDDAAMFVASRLFAALAAAHAARDPLSGEFAPIVHADVNPSNVVIPWDGYAKLVDFGDARIPGLVRPALPAPEGRTYLSPEQAQGAEPTPRSDVYSACVVLWELLTHRRVISRDRRSDREIRDAMAAPMIPPISTLRPDLPRALRDVLTRGLARDPERRDVLAGEIGAVLRAVHDPPRGRASVSESIAALRLSRLHRDPMETTPSLPQAETSPPPAGAESAAPPPAPVAMSPSRRPMVASTIRAPVAPPAVRASTLPPRAPMAPSSSATRASTSPSAARASTSPSATRPSTSPSATRASTSPPRAPVVSPSPPAVAVPISPVPPVTMALPVTLAPPLAPPVAPAPVSLAAAPMVPPPVGSPSLPVSVDSVPSLASPAVPAAPPVPAFSWTPAIEPDVRHRSDRPVSFADHELSLPVRWFEGRALTVAGGAFAAFCLVAGVAWWARSPAPPPHASATPEKSSASAIVPPIPKPATPPAASPHSAATAATLAPAPQADREKPASPERSDTAAPSDGTSEERPSARAAATSTVEAPASGKSTITVPPARAGHRVWIDGRLVGQSPGSFEVPCGSHVVRVGSQGASRPVEVPCGGDVVAR